MSILDDLKGPPCPNCGKALKIKCYKETPIYACDNEKCKMAFTIEEINNGSSGGTE